MKIKVQVLVESETGKTDTVENIVCLERGDLRLENLGLTLAEAKSILSNVQKSMVERQYGGPQKLDNVLSYESDHRFRRI